MRRDDPELNLKALARGLTFPHVKPRAGQDLMLRDVEGALTGGMTLLCSAPTGIGKTLAALFPAVALALTEDRRVYFVTAKNSQQVLALETLQDILPSDNGPGAIQIAARDKLCPFDGQRCSEDRCSLQQDVPERLERSGLASELGEHVARVVASA